MPDLAQNLSKIPLVSYIHCKKIFQITLKQKFQKFILEVQNNYIAYNISNLKLYEPFKVSILKDRDRSQ